MSTQNLTTAKTTQTHNKMPFISIGKLLRPFSTNFTKRNPIHTTPSFMHGQRVGQFKEIPHIVIFEIDWNVQ